MALVRDGETPSDEELARALDELAVAYHLAPEGEPADEDYTPPSSDFADLSEAYRERFPDFGLYPVVDPSGDVPAEPLLGDAIDDLADITRELEGVIWRFDHVGADDAHWYFRLTYQIHWGRHLRELAFYLHAKIW